MSFYIPLLFIIMIAILLLMYFIDKQKNKNQIKNIFTIILLLLLDMCFFVFLGGVLSEPLGIPPIYFDYFSYIGSCFLPVCIYFISIAFANSNFVFKRWYLLLFIIPILSLLVLWTNDFHHLFYEVYSINLNETVIGPYVYVYLAYTYIMLAIGLINLLRYSIKNSGFFSKQSILFLIGSIIPIVVNLLGTFAIIPMTIYITPISFAFAIFFHALAIFKFGFLKITPIALQKIVDKISDGYVVINNEDIIIDFNKTFLNMFGLEKVSIRNKNFYEFISKFSYFNINKDELQKCIQEVKTSDDTYSFDKKLTNAEKYFHIEINSIVTDNKFLGILILFKDTTQHMLDLKTIQNNQNMLMERERLASLGQLIGGIAHNLKTPIMSISGAAEGLSDLIKEYDESIGDPEVTNDDHHAIAKDMSEWVEKIKSYSEYMSDVITAVKGQAVTLSESENITFDIDELMKRVNILMKHELKNALIELNTKINVDKNTILHGDITSLVQVINNMISNSIQSYNGKTNQFIDLTVDKIQNTLVISIRDYGSGLPKSVQDKLFKEMITTKGKNGTGLGLFMSYSTIRAHFNGDITFETEKGKGTVFHIVLPLLLGK
mgnify:FL=1